LRINPELLKTEKTSSKLAWNLSQESKNRVLQRQIQKALLKGDIESLKTIKEQVRNREDLGDIGKIIIKNIDNRIKKLKEEVEKQKEINSKANLRKIYQRDFNNLYKDYVNAIDIEKRGLDGLLKKKEEAFSYIELEIEKRKEALSILDKNKPKIDELSKAQKILLGIENDILNNNKKITEERLQGLYVLLRSVFSQKDVEKILNKIHDLNLAVLNIDKQISDERRKHSFVMKEIVSAFSDEERLAIQIEEINSRNISKKEKDLEITKLINKYIQEQSQLQKRVREGMAQSFAEWLQNMKSIRDESFSWGREMQSLIISLGKSIQDEIINRIQKDLFSRFFDIFGKGTLPFTGLEETKQKYKSEEIGKSIGINITESVKKTAIVAGAALGNSIVKTIKDKGKKAGESTGEVVGEVIAKASKSFFTSKTFYQTWYLAGLITSKTIREDMKRQGFMAGFSLGEALGPSIAKLLRVTGPWGTLVTIGTSILGGLLGMRGENNEGNKRIEEQIKNINPSLEISNRQLELVNRNLIAMRQDLKPWIMPESFFFRSGLIPGFQSGGIVPGPIGSPRLAVVHGQEKILSLGQSPVRIENLNINVKSEATADEIVQVISDSFAVDSIRGYNG